MISGGRKEANLLFFKECIFGNHKCTTFSPFSVKIYTYIRFGRVARGHRPLALENFVFGGLNLHNFRPFFSLTFKKNIGLGGLKVTPAPAPPTQNIEGAQPPRASRFLSLCTQKNELSQS